MNYLDWICKIFDKYIKDKKLKLVFKKYYFKRYKLFRN